MKGVFIQTNLFSSKEIFIIMILMSSTKKIELKSNSYFLSRKNWAYVIIKFSEILYEKNGEKMCICVGTPWSG